MAITVGQLQAVLSLNNAGYMSSIQASRNAFRELGSDLASIGAKMTAAISLPLGLIGKQVLSVGVDYERAMNVFQVATKATTEDMKRAAQVAEGLGADMKLPATSAADAAKAMLELGKAGFTASQAMDAARGVLQLAAAAHIDEAKAAEIASNAINAFGLAAADSSRVADLLAAAANASSAEITDVALSLQQASAVAASAHFPIEDLVTAISEMANAGIKGSDAGTSLKTMILALQAPTNKAAEVMRAMGISVYDQAGAMKSLQQIISEFQPKLAAMSDEQRNFALKTIFGTDAIRAANIVIAGGVEKFDSLKHAVTQSGAAAELAGAQTKGLGGALEGLKSQFETVALKIYQSVAPGLEAFVRGLADVVGGLATVEPAVWKAAAAFAAVFALGGPIALAIGGIVSLIGGPLTIAIVGITGIAATMAAEWALSSDKMGRSTEGWASTLKSVFRDIAGVVGGLMDTFGALGNMVLIVGNAFASLANFAMAGIAALSLDFTRAEQFLTAGWRAATTDMNAAWNSMTADLGGRWVRTLQGMVDSGFSAVGGFANAGAAAGQAYGRALQAGLSQQSAGFLSNLASGSFTKGLSGSAADFYNRLRSGTLLQGGKPSVGGGGAGGGGLLDDVGKGAKKAAKEAEEALKKLVGDVNDYLGRVGEKIKITVEQYKGFGKEVRNRLAAAAADHKLLEGAVANLQSQLAVNIPKAIAFYEKLKQSIINANRDASKSTLDMTQQLSTSLEVLPTIIGKGYQVPWEEGVFVVNASLAKTLEAIDAYKNDVTIKSGQIADRIAEDAKRQHDDLLEAWDDLSRSLPSSFNRIIDGALSMSGKVGDALLKLGVKVKGWASDVIGLVDAIPGHFGDAARSILRTVDTWLQFADKVLGILHRLNNSIPGSLGDLVGSIIGIFKKVQTATTGSGGIVQSTIEDIGKVITGGTLSMKDAMDRALDEAILGPLDEIQGKATQAGASIGKSILGGLQGILSKVGGIAGAVGIFLGTRGQGVGTGVLGGAAAGAAIGTMIAPGIGTAIGAGIGAIAGLFGSGKSALQKAQEAAALQQAKDAIKLSQQQVLQAIEATKQSIVDTVAKARDILESIRFYDSIGRAPIKAFFKDLDRFMNLLAEEADSWAKRAKNINKEAVEKLSAAVGLISQIPAVFEAIRIHLKVPDISFSEFFTDAENLINRIGEFVASIPRKVQRKIGDFAERVREGLGLPSTLAESLNSLFGMKDVGEGSFAIFERGIDKLLESVGRVATKFEKGWLKTLSFFSEHAQAGLAVVQSAAASIQAAILTPILTESQADRFLSSVSLLLDKTISALLSIATDGLSKAKQIAELTGPIFAMLAGLGAGVKAAFDAAYSQTPDFNKLKTFMVGWINTVVEVAREVESEAVAAGAQLSESAESIFKFLSSVAGTLKSADGIFATAFDYGFLKGAALGMIQIVTELAQETSTEGVKQASLFAESTISISNFLKSIADTFKAIKDSAGLTIQNIIDQVRGYGLMVNQLRIMSQEIGPEGVKEASDFAAQIGLIADAQQRAINLYNSIANMKLVGAEVWGTFVANVKSMADAIIASINEALRAKDASDRLLDVTTATRDNLLASAAAMREAAAAFGSAAGSANVGDLSAASLRLSPRQTNTPAPVVQKIVNYNFNGNNISNNDPRMNKVVQKMNEIAEILYGGEAANEQYAL